MFLEKELCYKIIGCFLAVHNKYGSGHREAIYDRALGEEFEKSNISFIAKPRIPLYSMTTGKKIGEFVPDYLLADKVIVELKALPPFKIKEGERQLLEYLKISPFEIGYVVNFSEKTLHPKRFIHTKDHKVFLTNL